MVSCSVSSPNIFQTHASSGQSRAPKCPTAVSSWKFFSQTSGQIEEDGDLKVVSSFTMNKRFDEDNFVMMGQSVLLDLEDGQQL